MQAVTFPLCCLFSAGQQKVVLPRKCVAKITFLRRKELLFPCFFFTVGRGIALAVQLPRAESCSGGFDTTVSRPKRAVLRIKINAVVLALKYARI